MQYMNEFSNSKTIFPVARVMQRLYRVFPITMLQPDDRLVIVDATKKGLVFAGIYSDTYRNNI